MKTFQIRSTLFNKSGAHCLLWATLQQLVVALSTFFIIRAIHFNSAGETALAMKYIVFFVASLVIVYLPNTLSIMYLQKWRLSSFSLFIKNFVRRNQGLTTLAHGRQKNGKESWLTNEALQVYDESTDLLYQVYSTFLSAILNISVISLMLDGRILLWYMLAGVVLFVSNKIFQNRIAEASLRVQKSRKELSNVMLCSWENIFTGNAYNLSHWKNQFDEKKGSAENSAVHYDMVRSLISSTTVSLALLLIAIGNGVFLFENQANIAVVAALIVTLPRQVQIVQSIFAFFNIYLAWKGVSHRLDELSEVVLIGDQRADSQKFIDFPSIELSNGKIQMKVESVADLVEKLHKKPSGRWTLRGPNGAGKSTLLSLLSEQLGEKSFFLPSHFSDLCFSNQSLIKESDGNRLVHAFHEIEKLEDVDFVFLDEWDANLDENNISQLDSAIEMVGQNRIVIESRHRSSQPATA